MSTRDPMIMFKNAHDGTSDAVTDMRKISVADSCDQTPRVR